MFQNPRIILIGSVNSSKKTLEKLIEHQMKIVGVLGLDPIVAKNISGYQDLSKISSEHKINFKYFKKINDNVNIEFIRKFKPDLLFVVGLSQLIKKELIDLPKFGAIGYHPTALPKGRGRAAMAWLILGKAPAAATFFKIDEGVDSGPIWFQIPFEINEADYVNDAIEKVLNAIGIGLDQALPKLKNGVFDVYEQNHSHATFLGKRNPEDGLIDWSNSAKEIHALIRAVSSPLPGAYTYLNNIKLIILRASICRNLNYCGVPGRLLIADKENGHIIQTGDGLLKIEEIKGQDWSDLKVGKKLGFDFEKAFEEIGKKTENNSKNEE